MPHTASAKKDLRRNKKGRLRNRLIISALRTQTKKLLRAIEKRDIEDINKQLHLTIKMTDKAASKGVIKKGTAARRKSRLMKRVNKIKAITTDRQAGPQPVKIPTSI